MTTPRTVCHVALGPVENPLPMNPQSVVFREFNPYVVRANADEVVSHRVEFPMNEAVETARRARWAAKK